MPVIHHQCGEEMEIRVFTHNSRPSGTPTAIKYICRDCEVSVSRKG